MPPPDLDMQAISKVFRGRPVLRDVSLAVQPGEFVALLGPSGSGKSTLLKIAAGFEAPEPGGRIRLRGEDVTTAPPYRRNINTVFQNYALFPHLSVFDNIAYGPRRKRVPAAEVQRRVADALVLVGLEGFGRHAPRTLSGGEQQRVALARALVNRPAVLLLDEPLSALDLTIRRRMQSELKRIHAGSGTTFVFVTHDQEEALVLADRILVLRDGGLEQAGTARAIYDAPATAFVAGFIGAMNWLRGVAGPGGITLADGTPLRAPEAAGALAGPVRIGIRPERLRLAEATARPGPGENAVDARVTRATFLGPHTSVETRLADGGILHCLCPAAAGPPAAGSAVRCLWDAAATLVFAADP